jgi:glucarate dehydratase
MWDRRLWLQSVAASLAAGRVRADDPPRPAPLKITGLRVTPVALPEPPILAAGGCHGPYFLRTVVHLETDGKVVGIGETRGGKLVAEAFEKAKPLVVGKNAFAYRSFAKELYALHPGCYAGVELACLDACGKATGRRACELLGGPVRDEVEFAAYLFYRYAADHPVVLADKRVVDRRGKGAKALDDWGEVRTPEAMAAAAERFRKQWGFRVFKLKAGVLPPKVELDTMDALQAKLGRDAPLRIDPNARWRVETAVAAAKRLKGLNLEYYEDPSADQEGMAAVRKATGLRLSTNMCVTRFEHVAPALKLQPVDVVLCDHHYWGGIHACQELGRLCRAVGWDLSQHSGSHAGVTMAAMIAVGAVVPELTIASDSHYPWLPDGADIIRGPKLPIRGGRMAVPAGPGLGVELDEDKVARAHEAYKKCGMTERDDAATMRLFEPGWARELF